MADVTTAPKISLSKRVASRVLCTGVSALKAVGVTVTPARNSYDQLTGLTARWGRDDRNLTRGIVAEYVIDDHPVRFFISDENDGVQQFHVQGR